MGKGKKRGVCQGFDGEKGELWAKLFLKLNF